MRLEHAELGGEVEGIVVSGELDKSLLLSVHSHEGVALDDLDVEASGDSSADLGLGSLGVAEEDEGVVDLGLLHGSLSGEGHLDDSVVIELSVARDQVHGGKRSSVVSEGLGAEEVGGSAHLAGDSLSTLLNSLSHLSGTCTTRQYKYVI